MNLFKRNKNDASKIHIVSQGRKTADGKTFYILYTDYAEDAKQSEYILLFGKDYADKIMAGSWIYFNDKTKKIWNEDEEDFL